MNDTQQNTILRVVVGSQAHGLANPQSDTDYRGVFVVPTSEILKIGGSTKQTSWIEGAVDDTSWEIGHFLNLATHCNPTILEVFLSPVDQTTPFGDELRSLFPYVWNSADVRNAFIGYGLNQRKKLFDNKDHRQAKYATAYLRTLYQAWELLTKGTFTIRIADTDIGPTLKRFKVGDFTVGEVIQTCCEWETKVNQAYEQSPRKETDTRPINEFLLKVRKEFWS